MPSLKPIKRIYFTNAQCLISQCLVMISITLKQQVTLQLLVFILDVHVVSCHYKWLFRFLILETQSSTAEIVRLNRNVFIGLKVMSCFLKSGKRNVIPAQLESYRIAFYYFSGVLNVKKQKLFHLIIIYKQFLHVYVNLLNPLLNCFYVNNIPHWQALFICICFDIFTEHIADISQRQFIEQYLVKLVVRSVI